MPKYYYCYICRERFSGEKKFRKHATIHFIGQKCPYCGMKTKRLPTHLAFYHINPNKRLILLRDLAKLCKEAGTVNILKQKDLDLGINIDKSLIDRIRVLMKKV